MCWEKQNIFRSSPHTWVRSSRKGEGLPEEGWGGSWNRGRDEEESLHGRAGRAG